MPLKTELHRHLDASIRPSTLVELIARFDIDAPFKTEQDIREKFWLTKQMGSLQEVLDCFVLFQHVLRNLEALERVAFEAVEDAQREGIDGVELRYSPTFASEYSKLSWEDVLAALERGLRKASAATGIRAGLICIASRDYGPDAVDKTIEFALAHQKSFIGVDLAGPEVGFPCRLYQTTYRKAVDAGLPVTIHSGEATGPESVWEAIDLLGARRIGHGIRSIEDKELVARLAKDRILLEICPTSNYITRSVAKWSDHPLPKLLDAGVPVAISTDDPGIFGVTLGEEYARCKKYLGMTDTDLTRIDGYARIHSFLE